MNNDTIRKGDAVSYTEVHAKTMTDPEAAKLRRGKVLEVNPSWECALVWWADTLTPEGCKLAALARVT